MCHVRVLLVTHVGSIQAVQKNNENFGTGGIDRNNVIKRLLKKNRRQPDYIRFLDPEIPTLWYVEWRDHCTHAQTGWHPQDEDLTPVTVLAVGWIVKEDEECVVLVTNIDPNDGDYLHGQCILKADIRRAVKLEDQYNWRESLN